ncbi:MAG TPA: hypothetical protein VG722_11795 [Tepidisphaeraceae bacterium]|nr:hypothetical protein [Tepidisphaeraceae bacterium]
MKSKSANVSEWIDRHGGVLKLRPEFVARFYPDLHRIGQPRGRGKFVPERWIGSSVSAVSPGESKQMGLSMLAGLNVSLRDAVAADPEAMIGPKLLAAHGAEFRLLVKILDPAEPIVFHLHATDEQVRKMPGNFEGHRFGKDEAYYFLDAPKGPCPYTHVGLHRGVDRRELIAAVRKGRDHALELSPAVYQEYEEGLFVPAGVPHRPGTALTLEIQQPSDVYTLLETHAAGKPMSAEQIHPGFGSLDEAFKLIDMKVSIEAGTFKANRLSPKVISRRGGEIATIFPAETCKKFCGDRLRISDKASYRKDRPMVLLVWRGAGRINGMPVKSGDEFFVAHSAVKQGLQISQQGDDVLELFALMPGQG